MLKRYPGAMVPWGARPGTGIEGGRRGAEPEQMMRHHPLQPAGQGLRVLSPLSLWRPKNTPKPLILGLQRLGREGTPTQDSVLQVGGARCCPRCSLCCHPVFKVRNCMWGGPVWCWGHLSAATLCSKCGTATRAPRKPYSISSDVGRQSPATAPQCAPPTCSTAFHPPGGSTEHG